MSEQLTCFNCRTKINDIWESRNSLCIECKKDLSNSLLYHKNIIECTCNLCDKIFIADSIIYYGMCVECIIKIRNTETFLCMENKCNNTIKLAESYICKDCLKILNPNRLVGQLDCIYCIDCKSKRKHTECLEWHKQEIIKSKKIRDCKGRSKFFQFVQNLRFCLPLRL